MSGAREIDPPTGGTSEATGLRIVEAAARLFASGLSIRRSSTSA